MRLLKCCVKERLLVGYEGEGANGSLGVQTSDVASCHVPVLMSCRHVRAGARGRGSRRSVANTGRDPSSCHLLVLCSFHWSMLVSSVVSVVIDDFKASRSFIEIY